jgi:NADPH:quinone reductase-like Zn-dependent oxidoreductase
MSIIVRIHETGGPEVLRLEELEVGEPGLGELRVRIEAIGLNRSEAVFRSGGYLMAPQLPSLIGYEAAGIVEALGPDVKGFEPGQRVCILPTFRMGEYGVYGERALVPARSALPAPEHMTAVEAASVWMQFLTAWGIVEAGKASVGDFVLIPAASSSVGLAAIQICQWIGAEPIALTRQADKIDALQAQGARHVIDSSRGELVAEVNRITGGRGAKVVFDPVGGPFVETLANAMAPEGTLLIYGSLSGQTTVFPHWPACLKGLSIRGWVFSQIAGDPQRFSRVKDLILRGLEDGHLRPVVARTFPLAQIVEAHRYMESNLQVGKIVVTV